MTSCVKSLRALIMGNNAQSSASPSSTESPVQSAPTLAANGHISDKSTDLTPDEPRKSTSAPVPKTIAELLAKGVYLSQAAAAFGLGLEEAARLVVDLATKSSVRAPPDHLICPITQELFWDPVVTGDGITYERSAIEQHFKTRKSSPKTNCILSTTSLVSNELVKVLAAEWIEDFSALAPLLLQHFIDNVELELAAKFVKECHGWLKRFPVVRRLDFLEKSLGLVLHGTEFKEREDEFVGVAVAAGISKEDALLKAHVLSAGQLSYGQSGDAISSLLNMTSASQVYELPFSMNKMGTQYKEGESMSSENFEVGGVGSCYVGMKRKGQQWESYMFVHAAAPPAELRSMIVSLECLETKEKHFWRERGRTECGYGGKVANLNSKPCSFTIRQYGPVWESIRQRIGPRSSMKVFVVRFQGLVRQC
eukprot:gnl/TRDRNA2_/TRDRNA2_167055_c0_seq1.p1 gnl/TRDRNA2_/TRDRNA2_167055_c0~~gnl/TRDRNA2_/TRDRNA2_167055_c0_seq1.p1  ORF type:complete len:423 (+),score=44.53 gnl/TRDRNA2_/TRDRNA2_167055_c0_seq1:153-1421(+)